PAEIKVEAVEAWGRAAEAEVERAQQRIEPEEDAPCLDPVPRVVGDEGSADLSRLEREAAVNALEQRLSREPVGVHEAAELQAVAGKRARGISRQPQEAAPLEEIVLGQRRLAGAFPERQSQRDGMVTEGARGIERRGHLRVVVLRAERGTRGESLHLARESGA